MTASSAPAVAVSVVIPYHNKARWVGRAVRSALRQTLPPHEVIIVDDASPETLPAWIVQDPRLRVVRREKNGGAAAARNVGLREARGNLCAFLDADDIWLPRKLQRQVDRLAREEASGARRVAIACGFLVSSSFTQRIVCAVPKESSDVVHFASGCWFCPGSTILVRTADLIELGGYDESLSRLEDTLLFFRLALAGGQVVTTDYVDCVVLQDRKASIDATTASARTFLRLAQSALHRVHQNSRPDIAARLTAYVQLEVASSQWYAGAQLRAIFHLVRSQMAKPRFRVQVEAMLDPADLKAESFLIE